MKKLLLGNEAVARGLYEGGCRVASSYPGTPVLRLLNVFQLMMKSQANGHPMKRLQWRLLSVQQLQVRVHSAL